MNRLSKLAIRVAIVAVGFCAIAGTVYAAGLYLVPYTDSTDKAILAACNPDEYLPGVDQFFRALTDYTNYLLAVPLISWMIAYGLYRLSPRFKNVIVGLLAVDTIVFTVLTAMGKLWPNKTYAGVNVLLVVSTLIAFSVMTYLFYSMSHESMRRFARVFWLILLSVYLTDRVATENIKKAVGRPRPLNDANKPWNEHVRIIPDEVLRGNNSFPSGHTSGTFSLITPIFWYTRNRKVKAGLFGWACLQGFSRVYTAAHFPFCVLMGGLLGFGVGTLIFFAFGGESLREPKEPAALAPA